MSRQVCAHHATATLGSLTVATQTETYSSPLNPFLRTRYCASRGMISRSLLGHLATNGLWPRTKRTGPRAPLIFTSRRGRASALRQPTEMFFFSRATRAWPLFETFINPGSFTACSLAFFHTSATEPTRERSDPAGGRPCSPTFSPRQLPPRLFLLPCEATRLAICRLPLPSNLVFSGTTAGRKTVPE
jgi:hypothetical protein